MSVSDVCLICLKPNEKLYTIGKNDTQDESILSKLKKCVPELDWNLIFSICCKCLDDLEKVYEFKELCIHSYLTHTQATLFESKDVEVLEEENNFLSISDNECSGSDNDEVKSEPENNVDKFTCNGCHKEFGLKSHLTTHIKKEHKQIKRTRRKREHNCLNCNKTFTTEIALNKHSRSCEINNVEEKYIKNQVCEAVDTLDEKLKYEDRDSEVSVAPTCGMCGTTFCNKYLLKRHLKNVHAKEKNFKCDMCDRTFVSSVYLNAHKKYHSGARSHICSFCGKGFITTSDLYHHEKIHANKRAYRCEICPKAFNTSSDLHKHKICVHMDRSKWKYECSFCQRRFPLKTNLDTHTKTHTGERNFACHLCDRKCINRSVLMRHIETHSNVVSYKCNLCGQGYKYQKSLDIHMAKIHGLGDAKVPERIKKYFCHICPKSYFANNKLEKHIRSHTGERPFQCPACDKAFTDKSYVKQHLRAAHGTG